jgi:DNA-binding XRE family transcriptional regulator
MSAGEGRRQSLYVMKSEAGHCKIGISHNPKKRLASIQTNSAYRIQLVAVIPSERPCHDEILAHRLLEDRRAAGEWFNVSEAEAVHAIAQAQTMPFTKKPPPAQCYKEAERTIMQASELRDIRRKNRWTQEELARMIGMRRETVSVMEAGKAPIELRTELAVRYLDLIGGEPRRKEPR